MRFKKKEKENELTSSSSSIASSTSKPTSKIYEAETMFSFIINKYLKKPPSEKVIETGSKTGLHKKKKEDRDKEEAAEEEKEEKKNAHQMMTSDLEQKGCCSSPNCLGLAAAADHHHHHRPPQRHASKYSQHRAITTTTRISRSNFAKATTSTLFPNTQFTNHESLPSLSDALSSFIQTYPQYRETQEADRIRRHNYSHLFHHVCLDYTGFNLFSHSQLLRLLQPSSSSFFGLSYKSASLTSQVQYGGDQETPGLESAIRNRIMSFLNISPEDYTMVCTANRTSAFKLLVEAYPFHSNRRLLTVYDYESEPVKAMQECAQKRGAKIMSAKFSWPSLRIHSAKLKRILDKKRSNKKKSGLFVFPLQSRMTGVRYPYLWMRIAQENGWHVVLDACALGPKDLDTLGLSLIQPDFIICSFFKVVGENPSGFASLLIKKSSGPLLEASVMGRSIGIVSIVPETSLSQLNETDDLSGALSDIDTLSSFSGPMSSLICHSSVSKHNVVGQQSCSSKQVKMERVEQGETSSEPCGSSTAKDDQEKTASTSEIVELESNVSVQVEKRSRSKANVEIECTGLDHADSLGLLLISSRLRYITNWLVVALMKLRHPNSENGHPLVRIYGPRIKFERGPAIAFNVFDWKGEKVNPALVQKLADRSNISLSCGFLQNIWFSDKYEEERDAILERKICQITAVSGIKRKEDIDLGVAVVNASLGFLTNFEDAYKLWSFVARFLDADFVEKERWRYVALNQKLIDV